LLGHPTMVAKRYQSVDTGRQPDTAWF
jgi:hypothetical protein